MFKTVFCEIKCKISQGCFWLSKVVQERQFNSRISHVKKSSECLFSLFLLSLGALLSSCPVSGWIVAGSSVPSAVTFSRTLMQWDITQAGSTRRATAKARTPPLRIYHPNKRPLPTRATQEYIKLQHNSRSRLQVFHPTSLLSRRKESWVI